MRLDISVEKLLHLIPRLFLSAAHELPGDALKIVAPNPDMLLSAVAGLAMPSRDFRLTDVYGRFVKEIFT